MSTALPKPFGFAIFLTAFFFSTSNAQVATYYNWTQSTTTYTPGTSPGTPADIFVLAWDDLANNSVKLPFGFTFNGTLYTAANGYLGLDTDGWFCFSNGMPTMTGQLGGGSWVTASDHTGMYLNGSANNNGFAGFNADLHYQSFATFTGTRTNGSPTITGVSSFANIQIGTRLDGPGITNGTVVTAFNAGAGTITMSANATANRTNAITPYASIIYFTRGTAPNRQFVVQWTQVRRYNYPDITVDRFNFQMILNEGGGVPNLQTLQVVYGSMNTSETANLEFQVGLRGASAADFNARTSSTAWASTTAATANTDLVRLNNSIKPANGLTFTWSPCTVAPGAAGVITGNSPVCPGSTQTYSIPAVAGATSYTWTYSGTNTTFSATTSNPSNTFVFGPTATGGTITVTPTNLCGSGTASTKAITVSAVSVGTISYPLSSYCTYSSPVAVTQSGPAGGTYTASPVGLSINASTGQITPGSSSAGSYIVTYSYSSSGCPLTATTNVDIKSGPTVTATATPSILCTGGGNSQLQANASTGYTVSSIPYSILTPSGSPTVIWNTYQIDAISSAISLPFTFTYYGQGITQIFATTEGYMQLGTSTGYDYSPDAIPNAATPNNIISLAWSDLVLDPGSNPGAYVRYFVNGTAPNRVFVLEYNKLRYLAANGEVTGQIRLYENGNTIEIAITRVDDEGDNDIKVLGIENSTGTDGLSPSGRNYLVWNTSNEAWRFSMGGPYTYAWSPATYLNSTSIYNPLASGVASPITYTVRVTDALSGCYTDKTVPITIAAPLSGTYTVGSGGNFTTLTAAINAYNTLCIGGPIVFSLIDNNYNIAETFPLTINSNAYASSTNTLTIKPAAGKTVTISGSSSTGVFILNGADYVTIDGSNLVNGTTRNLTVTNTNTNVSDLSMVIYILAPSASDGATFNTVKNAVLSGTGGTQTWCGVFGGGTDPLDIPLTGNTNNTLFNNKVIKAMTGIALVGPNGNELKNVIDSNEVGSRLTAEVLGFSGIELYQQASAQVSRNVVRRISSSTSGLDAYGIFIVGTGSDCVVSENLVDSVLHTSIFGAHGIFIGNTIDNVNLLVKNNMISNIVASGYNGFNISDNGYGISVYSGSGYKIYNNSVALSLNPTLAAAHRAACFYVANTVTTAGGIDFRNNILANFQTVGNANSRYGMLIRAANNVFSNINYNVYYSASTNLLCRGSNATTFTTLPTVQTNLGGDLNSIAATPVFISSIDLHLNAASNGSISNMGTPLAEVLTDFEDQTRNGLTPDPGADEYVYPNYGSWVGRVSTAWTDPRNWEANFVPLSTTDVYIKGGYTNMPLVTTVQPLRDVNISAPIPANTPTLTINGGTLQVYRNMSKSAGTVVASNGTLEMKGAAAQTIPASFFQNNNLLNLIVDNANTTTGVTLGGALDIYRSVTFGASGRKLTTNDNLTFKSTATQTAWLGQLTASNVISGQATIERNIPLHNKAWQFLSTPINSSSTVTVKQAWQEGATTANGNPKPGYGTQLGSIRADAIIQTTPGFDVKSVTPSIKTYDRATNNYKALNRTDTVIYNPKGYMVFVRGDRSVINFSGPNSTSTETVLRMKGTLNTPAAAPATISVPSAGFESAGNPYPSAINYRKLTATGGVNAGIFYMWDPKLATGSAYGLGAFQTFTWNGASFTVTPGGGSYSGGNTNIESGQAFFFPSSGAGTLQFSEAAKESGSYNTNKTMPPVKMKMLRTNLNVLLNGQPELIDGVMVQYGNYSNEVDAMDAVKLNNSGENLSMLNGSTHLAVERRGEIVQTDTLFYRLGQMRAQEYAFQFIPTGLATPGLRAWLEDNYLNTASEVSLTDTNYIQFSVTGQAGSFAANRFRLVFIQKRKVEILNEANLNTNLGNPGSIKQMEESPAISVYPNPVVNREIKVGLQNFRNGEQVTVQLISETGNIILTRVVKIGGKFEQVNLKVKEMAGGSYHLVATGEKGIRLSQGVSIP